MAQNEYRIDTRSPAGKDLKFWAIVGLEAMSQPSIYQLRVLSESEALSPKDILGHAFDVVMLFEDSDGGAHERHCQGHAVRFSRRGTQGRYFEYAIELRSWLWLLDKRFNARIYQGMNVLEVMDATIDDSPISGLKKINKDGVLNAPERRPYCVQFQESDFQFLSRLLQDEGIYYWFDAHDAPGTLYLSNASDAAHAPLPVQHALKPVPAGAHEARFHEVLHSTQSARLVSGRHASHDSDFKAIRRKLVGSSADAAEHELADLEVFEFPGGHLREADADKRSRVRMEELAARRLLCWMGTSWPDVAVGRRTQHHAAWYGDEFSEDEHLILTCLLHASHPGYEGTDTSAPLELEQALMELLAQDRVNAEFLDELAAQIKGSASLTRPYWGARFFLITSMPAKVPFRPPRTVAPVRMPGPQTAIVVGPKDKEIHTDEFGRVKVHFHWDRYDASDEKSTCWVRVSQPWAGKGWGGYFIPRIGQEVIVDFLNGDPDRPIIVGRMYNDDQPIPFASETQSGFKTRSTPGGNTSTFNELRFEDRIGQEQIHVHAEKDLDVLVEKMETRKVGTNSYTKVAGEMQLSVGGKRTSDIGGNDILKVVKDRNVSVGGNQGTTIKGTTDFTSIGDWHSAAPNIEVNGTVSYKLSSIAITSIATAAYKIDAATYALSAPAVTVSATTIEQKASAAQEIKAGAALNMGATEVTVTAKTSMKLQCGPSTIELTPAGIKISAPKVDVNGAGMVTIIGAVVKTNA